MPRDSSGVFTLPAGYLAVTGETIQASQHNPPLEDIAQALTGSVPRTGAAGMTGPLKLADGTVSAPSLTFGVALNTGFYKTTSGIGVTVNGVQVAEFGGSAGFIPVGAVIDFAGAVAPAGWLLCYGQAVSRATYAALFAAIGTSYGVGDGSTTFAVPDRRGRLSVGKDNMGGAAANRVTTAGSGVDGATLGAAGGSQALQQHSHAVTDAGHAHAINDPGHSHPTPTGNAGGGAAFGPPALNAAATTGSSTTGITIQTATTGITIADAGSGASQNMPPALVFNAIIYAGV